MPTQQTQVCCGLCTIRIPKNRRDLICSNCNDIKHYKCQRLSKTDVAFINETQRLTWTCRECIVDALPVNDWGTTKAEKFKVQCHSCTGYSHKETNNICTLLAMVETYIEFIVVKLVIVTYGTTRGSKPSEVP